MIKHIEKLLFLAIIGGQYEEVEKLLADGANVNVIAKDVPHSAIDNGDLPLLLAARHGYADIGRLLINAGADIDYQRTSPCFFGNEIETPLLIAVEFECVDFVHLLTNSGVNLEIVNHAGYTALGVACAQYRSNNLRNIKMIKLLLDSGANVNHQHNEGSSLVASLSYMLDVDVPLIRLLVERGADPYLKSKDGVDALTIAKMGDRQDIIDFFNSLNDAKVLKNIIQDNPYDNQKTSFCF